MLVEDPNLTIDLADTADPNITKSSTESDEESFEIPYSERLEPHLHNDLKLKLEPTFI
jgi:hypothetical protein